MAENSTVNQFYVLDNDVLKRQIDELFFKWFDKNYKLLVHKDESFSAEESLDRLADIVKHIRSIASNESNRANKALVQLGTDFTEFLQGDAEAALSILRGRPKEDHISKVMWLINITTTVAVLGKELKEDESSERPLTRGPLRRSNVSARNIEQFVFPVQNSTEMKIPSNFLGKVLPSKFASVAKHANLANSAAKRAAFSGHEYHNIATMDSIYHDLGESLIFVSTDFYVEASNALTNNGRLNAANKAKTYNFNKLSKKEHTKIMETLHAAFRKYSNYTVELNMLSNINDKLIVDAALCAFYDNLTDKMRESSGFKEDDLMRLPVALRFSKKFPHEYNTAYNRYSNQFVNGMFDAIKREQETVKKEWFENKITGERVFRRGRLAGHGNKFMHTAPMEWLDAFLQKHKEKHGILTLIPRLAMTTLKIVTNPTLHKLRKKLTSTLYAALSSFATGVKANFDKTGRSTEITYEDVIKALNNGKEQLKKIKNEKTKITNESVQLTERSESDDNEDEEHSDNNSISMEALDKLAKALSLVTKYANKASQDDAVKSDIKAYKKANSDLNNQYLTDTIKNIITTLNNIDTSDKVALYSTIEKICKKTNIHDFTEEKLEFLLNNVVPEYNDYVSAVQNYNEKQDERDELDSSNANYSVDSSNETLVVGEKTVKICEDVYDVLNKYIARQWNLLALHSNYNDMPLCAKYVNIDIDKPIADETAPKTQQKNTQNESILGLSLSDWLKLYENDELNEEVTSDERRRADDLSQFATEDGAVINDKPHKEIGADRLSRDSRDHSNKNNGNTTSVYPVEYNGKYRYHGIELVASSTDNTKNGFGVLAERLCKIAEPVHEFRLFVDAFGTESGDKIFNNDMKDFKGDTSKIVNPAESFVYTSNDLLYEDIVNKTIKVADKAADKLGNIAKAGINKVGKAVGTGLGKTIHGITHTGTEDKNKKIAKTIDDFGNYEVELTYAYSRKLKLSYLNEGAKIIVANILTTSAKNSFNDIVKLSEALHSANFANSRSINAIDAALQKFKNSISGVKFKPCKAIINYKLAKLINEGKLTDNENPDFGAIKGLYISNWENIREYSRELTDKELKNIVHDKRDVNFNHLAKSEQEKIVNLDKKTKEEKHNRRDVERAHQERIDNYNRAVDNAERQVNAERDGTVARNKERQAEETLNHLADSTNIDITSLSRLYEQINNSMNWKEYLNG